MSMKNTLVEESSDAYLDLKKKSINSSKQNNMADAANMQK